MVLNRNNLAKKIVELTQTAQDYNKVFKETLRSVLAILGNIQYIDGENTIRDVKVTYGRPERVIAKFKEETNIILPIISVSQVKANTDDTRLRYRPVLVHEKIWSDDRQRAIRVIRLAPVPINIQYELRVWSKYQDDIDQILQRIRLKFNPGVELSTKFYDAHKLFILEELDESSFDVGDAADRVIRKVLVVEAETYIENPRFLVTHTGEIEQVVGDFEIIHDRIDASALHTP